jgi:hypothetical protein
MAFTLRLGRPSDRTRHRAATTWTGGRLPAAVVGGTRPPEIHLGPADAGLDVIEGGGCRPRVRGRASGRGDLGSRRPGKVVRTREGLARFVNDLRHEFVTAGSRWEHQTLEHYLEALAAWLVDLDGGYAHRGTPLPDQPVWALVAHLLVAASIYE